ncbi:hypothetical protein [Streptomyces sp. NBC_00076]|uniref:hypothetical protein n=1 Tax=Streptomyces sp. NBC_00076 TaxID=2975642 RepID=UPI003247158E
MISGRRIAHGVRAVKDPALVARLDPEGAALDVWTSSNVALGVVTTLSVHPSHRWWPRTTNLSG